MWKWITLRYLIWKDAVRNGIVQKAAWYYCTRHFVTILSSVFLLIAFVAFAIWSDRAAWEMITWVRSVPFPSMDRVLLGLGVTAAVVILFWLLRSSTRRGVVAGASWGKIVTTATVMLVLLGIGIWAYNRQWIKPEPVVTGVADTTFTDVIRSDHPVEGVMPQNHNMDWVVDKSKGDHQKIESHVVWRGTDKVRIFTVKPGVDAVPISIRVYPCTAEIPCKTPNGVPPAPAATTPTTQGAQDQKVEGALFISESKKVSDTFSLSY